MIVGSLKIAHGMRGESMIVGSLAFMIPFDASLSIMVVSFTLVVKDLVWAAFMRLSITTGSSNFPLNNLICFELMISSIIVGSWRVDTRDLFARLLFTVVAERAFEMCIAE